MNQHPATIARANRLGRLAAFAATAALLAIAGRASAAPTETGFHLTGEAQVGGEGSWDYLQYDPIHRRLFVARIGGVEVFDTTDMKPVGTIPAYAGTRVHGVALAPRRGIGVTSEGADSAATVFDPATLKVLRRVHLRHAPDAILLDDGSGKAVAFGEDDPVAMAFDPVTGSGTAEIELPGSPESPVSDGKGAIYVDLSDKGEIVRIDTRSWKVESHWAIGGGCDEPTPMAIDRRQGRIFVGCRSGVLAIVDIAGKSLIASLPIAAGADSVVFDPGSGLVFVSCNAGVLAIFREATPNAYVLVQNVPTAPGARTMAFDAEQLRAFLPVADKGPMLPKVGDIPPRPAIVPETFRILTVSK